MIDCNSKIREKNQNWKFTCWNYSKIDNNSCISQIHLKVARMCKSFAHLSDWLII